MRAGIKTMKKQVKRFLSAACIILGITLVIGTAVFVFTDRREEAKNQKYRADILSRIRSAAPQPEKNGSYDGEPLSGSIALDGVDYLGIVGIPSLDFEYPISNGGAKNIAAYRISEYGLAPTLSSDGEDWAAVADATVGDEITITDMRGRKRAYKVSGIDRAKSYNPPEQQNQNAALALVAVSNNAYIIIRCENE